jgi:mannose-6-phosphate isomerase-like protein (cupin superfamily)
MGLIETYATTEEGYHPFLIREGWQVAKLNYIESQHINYIDKIEVHHQTDEVFVLLKGKAVLITVTIIEGVLTFSTELMLPQITYNIPKNVWHNIAMEKGSEVLIVEQSNTHLHDVDFLNLNIAQQQDLKYKVENVLK